MSDSDGPITLIGRDLRKTFRRGRGERVDALNGVSIDVAHGTLTALVGPDGAGKTTLIRLAAGLMLPDGGDLKILGIDVAAEPQRVQDRIGYMPQRFGLYEDLSVQENIDLYADLHGVSMEERRQRYPSLMEMTALGPFTQRLAGRLSGGMKQKLGLACTLVRAPELLLLDEPTVGVDPLSRRELWNIILQLVNQQHMTVLVSTSYLDEAERCGHVAVMHDGNILAQGHPDRISSLAQGRVFLAEPPAGQKAREYQARLLDKPEVLDAVPQGGRVRIVLAAKMKDEIGRAFDQWPLREADPEASRISAVDPRFEDGFMVLLKSGKEIRTHEGITRPGAKQPLRGRVTEQREIEQETSGHSDRHPARELSPSAHMSRSQAMVEVQNLVRRFGKFIAVDHVTFEVQRGEIFGLLGPNGAGKTTTFRMLCGLLRASEGTLRVAGADLRRARASARQHIGYVAQKFSLYGQLSVSENLEFFASAYNLRGAEKSRRIDWALQQFELSALAILPSGNLPGGFKQRLAMAAALLHEPETLFLDEPTSGADPLARRDFWRRITALSQEGVTVVITTHFMEEAEYCDRIAILDAGRILAQGTPAAIRSRAGGARERDSTMEDAFIAIVEQARAKPVQTGSARGAA
jgi:ABC-2 type transport system ATP-binding protein